MSEQAVTLEQMKMMAELTPGGIGLYEAASGKAVFRNKAYYGLIGFSEAECAAMPVNPACYAFPGPVLISQNKTEQGETDHILRGGGGLCWVKLSVSQIALDGKRYAYVSYTDVTPEMENGDSLKLIAENTDNAITTIRVTGGREELLYANDRFFELMGIERRKFRPGEAVLDPRFVPPEDYARLSSAVRCAIASGKRETMRHRLINARGEHRWVVLRVQAVSQGEARILTVVASDVTEQKEAEQRIERERRRFQLVADEMNAAVFEWDLRTGGFYSSAAYRRYAISQVDTADVLNNRGSAELVHPDDQAEMQRFFAETQSGRERAEVVLRLKMTAGGYHWVHMLGFFYRDADGTPSQTLGVIIDVNQEREHSFMLNQLVNAMPGGVGIFIFGETLGCEFYSDGFAKMAGISRREMDELLRQNRVLSALIAPVDFDKVAPAIQERSAKGLPLNMTYRYVYSDGSIRWLHLSAEKMGDRDGLPVYYCVFTTPSEEAALYQSIIEDSAVGIFIAERRTRSILYRNSMADVFCGIPAAANRIGVSAIESTKRFGISPMLTQEQVDALRSGEFTEFHMERCGRYLTVRAKAIIWNKTDSYVLYITDETREHDHQLSLQKLIDEVPGGIGIYDIDDGQLRLRYLNDAYYQMLGLDRAERMQYYGTNAFQAIHPDDEAAMKALAAEIIGGANRAGALHRVRNGEGQWVWLNFMASVVERSAGHIRVYAAITDCDALVCARQEMELTQKRERALLASIPGGVAIYRLKKDGRFAADYSSVGMAKMCGYDDVMEYQNYLKDDVMVNVAEEDRPALTAAIQECLKTGQPFSRIFHLHTQNGPDILNRLDANAIEANIGEDDMALWYAVHTRVSEDSQRALQEQHRYRGLMSALDMVLLEWEKGKGFYASEKYRNYALSDQSFDRILSNTADLSVIHPDDIPALERFFATQRAHSERSSTMLRMKMKDGSYRWTEMLGFYEFDRDGAICRVIGVLRDIDRERIEQNERLQKALEEANQANQAKTSFLSRVSHDMRTPLNGILGLTTLMKDVAVDPRILHDLEQLELSGQYLLNLINDTLDVSRIENGRMELHPVVCDSRVAFNNVQRLARPGMEEKHIRLELQADNLPFTYIYVDEGRLEQIAMNVLGNAVKFTPEGGVIRCKAETLSVENGIVTDHFIVEDTGCGMSPEFLPHLFEPFAQENATTTNAKQGTGLGMSITKRLVELMDGEISVTSEKGVGTRFDIVLRLPIATREQVEAWRKTLHGHADAYNLQGRRILLCEDHPLNKMIAIRLLEKKGMQVEHAENGRVGLERFAASAPGDYDAILMDIRMPVMDGIDACRAIRALPRPDARTIPILAMTANALDDDVRRTRDVGMDAHLSKPIQPERLFGALEQLINPAEQYIRQRVLVVDDVAANRAAIRAALEPAYEVFEADGGVQALALLREKHGMDAVVTDVQMPDMNGEELVRQIRADDAYRHMVIIANTQYDNIGQEEQLLALGADDFIYKPTNPDIVRIRVRNALHKL